MAVTSLWPIKYRLDKVIKVLCAASHKMLLHDHFALAVNRLDKLIDDIRTEPFHSSQEFLVFNPVVHGYLSLFPQAAHLIS